MELALWRRESGTILRVKRKASLLHFDCRVTASYDSVHRGSLRDNELAWRAVFSALWQYRGDKGVGRME